MSGRCRKFWKAFVRSGNSDDSSTQNVQHVRRLERFPHRLQSQWLCLLQSPLPCAVLLSRKASCSYRYSTVFCSCLSFKRRFCLLLFLHWFLHIAISIYFYLNFTGVFAAASSAVASAFANLSSSNSNAESKEAVYFWFVTACHELAHNVEHGHNFLHEDAMENLSVQFMPALIQYVSSSQSV